MTEIHPFWFSIVFALLVASAYILGVYVGWHAAIERYEYTIDQAIERMR